MKAMRISTDSIHFLGVKTMIPMEDAVSFQARLWKELYISGTMEELMKTCDSKQVYGLLGAEYDLDKQLVSYHIVCENCSNIENSKYEAVTIDASEYFVVEGKAASEEELSSVHNELYSEAYKKIFEQSKYEAKIDPYTMIYHTKTVIIEKKNPIDTLATQCELSVWVPIHKSNC